MIVIIFNGILKQLKLTAYDKANFSHCLKKKIIIKGRIGTLL